MKSFKEYLTESKKVYEFKVKIAGDHSKDAVEHIKAALSEFHVASVGKPRTSPIQERQTDFPQHKNTQMTVYEITTNYPATSLQIRDCVAVGLGASHNCIKVHSALEEKEYEINHQYDERTGESLVGKMQDPSDNSDLASENQKMSFLKDLNKQSRTTGEQVTGYNDALLASGAPKHVKETPGKQVKVETKKFSNIFTKQVKLPKGAL
jgi:hypothetical protein